MHSLKTANETVVIEDPTMVMLELMSTSGDNATLQLLNISSIDADIILEKGVFEKNVTKLELADDNKSNEVLPGVIEMPFPVVQQQWRGQRCSGKVPKTCQNGQLGWYLDRK